MQLNNIIRRNKKGQFVKGSTQSKKMRKIISLANIGRKHPHSEEAKKKMSKSHKGKKHSEEHKRKIGLSLSGEKSPAWKGGITPLVNQIRNHFKSRQWRSDVFTRDDFTCQKCSKRGCYLEAHHIKSFSKIIEENKIKTLEQALNCEELWNINNGITWCLSCHNPTKGRKKRQ